MKTALTDRAIKAAKPAERPYNIHDAVVPGLLLEVRPSGLKRLALLKRFPGSRNPTRRLIGQYGAVTLEQARTAARRWLELLQAGIDPAAEVERNRVAEARKQRHTFAHVVERYLAIEVIGPDPQHPRHRGHRKMRNALDILVALFGDRPVAHFEDDPEALMGPLELIGQLGSDRALVKLGCRKKPLRPGRPARPSPEQARALFTFLHMVFNFAVEHGGFGLTRNPIDHIRKVRRFGATVRRDHTPTDEELAALVIAADRLPAPHRYVYRALVLSGLRLREVTEAGWSEVGDELWTIPASRMKGKNGKARPHAVPITTDLRKLFDSIPRGNRGAFIFSVNGGRTPVATGGSALKATLADEMLHVLRIRAKARGEDPAKVELRPWRNHDIRRAVKSGLARLGVRDDVSEMILAHKRGGISGIYDTYDRLPERRAALEQWANYVTGLVNPRPANVIPMSKTG
jgi:Arm DNA-binding domain/Phage integrase family